MVVRLRKMVIFGAVRDQVQSFGNVHQISIVVMDKDGRTFFLTEKVIKFSFGFYHTFERTEAFQMALPTLVMIPQSGSTISLRNLISPG